MRPIHFSLASFWNFSSGEAIGTSLSVKSINEPLKSAGMLRCGPSGVGMSGEDNKKITVLIVSYNTSKLTIAAIKSVLDTTPIDMVEILVYDNASTDGSADAISLNFPDIFLIRGRKNIGFAAANNHLADMVRTKWILLLNPDTEVHPGAIQNLLKFAEENPDCGIYGGRTVFPDGSLNVASCWMAMTPRSLLFSALGLSRLFKSSSFFNYEEIGGWARDTVRNVDIVVGCFMMVSKSLWCTLGGFDRAFFMYGEEADFCLRAKRMGYSPAITPDAEIMHLVGASSKERSDKIIRLAAAKISLIKRHWNPAMVGLGVSLIKLWVFVRFIAYSFLAVFMGKKYEGRRSEWRSVWRKRSAWVDGYDLG